MRYLGFLLHFVLGVLCLLVSALMFYLAYLDRFFPFGLASGIFCVVGGFVLGTLAEILQKEKS